MKAAPTLEGGLRIDAEENADWTILSLICIDAANMPGASLADRLSAQASPQLLSENSDWKDYVLPDLRETFSKQISEVAEQIQAADRDEEGQGSILVENHQVDLWYGTLNQARLSLEAQYGITSKDADQLKEPARSARYRYEFYTLVQSWLLSVM